MLFCNSNLTNKIYITDSIDIMYTVVIHYTTKI